MVTDIIYIYIYPPDHPPKDMRQMLEPHKCSTKHPTYQNPPALPSFIEAREVLRFVSEPEHKSRTPASRLVRA